MSERTRTVADPELKSIMATAVEAARSGGNVRGMYRVEVNLGEKVTVEAKARNFRLVIDEPPSFGGGDADFSGFYGLSENPPVGFDRIRCEVTIEADAPAEQVREFERLVEERCVGHGTIRRPVPIETTWHIKARKAAATSGGGDGTAP